MLIFSFSKFVSSGLKKSDKKFISDMIYGLAAGKDIKISNVARELYEDIKLDNTIERLCLHLGSFDNLDKIINNIFECKNFVENNKFPYITLHVNQYINNFS